jgi:digeranylgeranylglycerophospholipid reductase
MPKATLPTHVDVVVVGAGPVGSNVARLLADKGHSVLLLEEHPAVGLPVQCAGLITPRIFDHAPFPIGDLHQNDLHGAKIFAPNGTAISFETDKVQAQAMDRAGFDQRMAEHAVQAGAQIFVATKAVAAERVDDGIVVTVQKAEAKSIQTAKGTVKDATKPAARVAVHARMVIGADGIRGNVAKWFGLPPVGEQVSAYEVELSGCTLPDGDRIIPMFAGRAQAPGFFSWIIPLGGGRTRSGLAVAPGMNEAAAKQYYERMFDDEMSRDYLTGSKEVYRIIGGIPLGLRKRLVTDRVAVVGDAAGMAKPTSGGGIYMGLVASEHLAEVVHAGLEADDLSARRLKPYEKLVRAGIAKELRKGTVLRNIYKKLNDSDLNQLVVLCNKPKVRAIIESVGDIDYPSRLVLPVMRAEPRFVSLFAKAMLRRGSSSPPAWKV